MHNQQPYTNVTNTDEEILLQVTGLTKQYTLEKNFFLRREEKLLAVDDVSLTIHQGKTLGLVGESGCGKSTLGKLVLKVEAPTAGKILFDGQDITNLKGQSLRNMRRNMQGIFQDADASLNPRMKIEDIVKESLTNYHIGSKEERRQQVIELLHTVGLGEEILDRYPHEFSGGQKQRITIARALALRPKLILCDEATASLDVSIQAQVLNLLKKLREVFGLSYLFISHDIAAVKYISDEVAVMYLGKIVERIDSKTLIGKARHPYTRALLQAVPIAGGEKTLLQNKQLKGEPPNPMDIGKGCRFYSRCECREAICNREEPPLKEVRPGHQIACHVVA
ncbi:ABC transporter ATP-binding protein [Natronincola ferrireducens]|uniref:Oligopeptide transport system ATP-binding protein n=1 Tax=Natronincola ferrireducens TaxID=393762 RepID=A0A1G9GK35_9FIRM|nr:ABC transporter ATP-binding protein [Natronincola ferrireducens]SDL01060.1 oligopeptide transport system ATP-binding protein [Natronincola ferrireducens]